MKPRKILLTIFALALTGCMPFGDQNKMRLIKEVSDNSMPENERKPATEGKLCQDKIHIVQSGESLMSISKKFYNTHKKYPLILKANPDLDPSKLKVGDQIIVPHIDTEKVVWSEGVMYSKTNLLSLPQNKQLSDLKRVPSSK